MEKDQTINIHVNEGTHTLEILHGQALPKKEPVKVNVTGLITAPGEYWERCKALHVKENTIALIDRHNTSIKLITDKDDAYRTEITGGLTINPDFTKFGINDEKEQYSPTELATLLKKNKHFFSDTDVHAKVITALTKLKYRITTEVEQMNDKKGNVVDNMRTVLISQDKNSKVVPDPFELNIALFKGEPKQKFMVEIEVDVYNSELVCYLISPGVIGLFEEIKTTIIDRELSHFKDICCLEV